MKKKIIIIFGTRPEAIKMAPVIEELKKYKDKIVVKVVVTAQHREMLDQVLKVFNIKPDYDLNIMLPSQTLFDISVSILNKIGDILQKESPDMILVHGDTPTSLMASLSAFYLKIPVGHVEAGLRTYDKYNPFPEEMNRQMIDVLADYYFAPTKEAEENLLREGKDKEKILVTGNTAIDAVTTVAAKNFSFHEKRLKKIDFNKKVILMTCHRRESWGEKMREIFLGIKMAVEENPESLVIFPVHPNPAIKDMAEKVFGNCPNVRLFGPFDYVDMIVVMKRCYLIATDSGGLQEEGPVFHKPVLVLREVTERPEGIDAGVLKIIGTTKESVYKGIKLLLTQEKIYRKMSSGKNPYGDGKASKKIVSYLLNKII